MILEELKSLMAASLLSGSVKCLSNRSRVGVPERMEIEAAVKVAGEIWAEVLHQEAIHVCL